MSTLAIALNAIGAGCFAGAAVFFVIDATKAARVSCCLGAFFWLAFLYWKEVP